jgi:5-methylthioadenosine/S-adenosylhomocysteine deaminase
MQVAFNDVHHVPTFDVISHLVYVTDEQDVSSVVVDGVVLMREREFLTLDIERIRTEANALAARITAGLNERNDD